LGTAFTAKFKIRGISKFTLRACGFDSPEGVQVNVTYQLLQAGGFLAEYRILAVLEKLAMPAIFAVEAHGIAR
jgi:hypothetical protein